MAANRLFAENLFLWIRLIEHFMKRNIFVALLFLPFLTLAQNTMYFMESLPQASVFNPAFRPRAEFYLGLPGLGGISANAYNSAFNYNWLDDFTESVGRANFNAGEALQSAGETNRFLAEAQANIFSLGFRMKDEGYFSFMAAVNNNFELKGPSDMVYLLTDFDELSADDFPIVVDNLRLVTTSYISLGFAYSRIINENLTLGISPHINLNIAGIHARNISYRVEREYDYGGFDYDHSISGEAEIGLPAEMNPDAREGNEVDLDESILSEDWFEENGISDVFKNKSFSLDLGATYEWNRWMFSGSILNVGASAWRRNGYSLSGNEDALNSLEEKVIIGIPTKIYLGVNRQFSPKWNYGLLLHNRFYKGGSNASATLSLNGYVGKMLSVSSSYTAGYKFNNFGLGFRIRFLPGTDLYLITDNIIQAFGYKNAHRLSAAAGINISYGLFNGRTPEPDEELQSPE